ncbi:MAG: dihydroneopterin triphosphate diphosphatase [Gammaproteobacteria bacterium]
MFRDTRRPESVLVLVASRAGEVLLLERVIPPGFWQSVTGSLEWSESAAHAAARELFEETGIRAWGRIENLDTSACFAIRPEWRHKYAADVVENHEHWFRLWLPQRVAIRLAPREHRRHEWVPAGEAAARVSSWSNRAALERFIVTHEARSEAPSPRPVRD